MEQRVFIHWKSSSVFVLKVSMAPIVNFDHLATQVHVKMEAFVKLLVALLFVAVVQVSMVKDVT